MRLIIVLRFARLSSDTEEAVCGWRGKGRAFRLFFRETPRGICTAPTTFRPDTLSVQRARERLRSDTGRQSPGKTQREGDIQLIPSPVQKCLQTNQRENHRPDAATSPPARQHTCARRRANPPPRGGAGAPGGVGWRGLSRGSRAATLFLWDAGGGGYCPFCTPVTMPLL